MGHTAVHKHHCLIVTYVKEKNELAEISTHFCHIYFLCILNREWRTNYL